MIRGRLRDCVVPMAAGGSSGFSGLQVRYRLLALDHVTTIETPNSDDLLLPYDPCPAAD